MSKNILIWGGTALVIVVVWVWFFFFRPWPIKNYPSASHGPILMFGDSLVAGVGATPGNDLPSAVGKLVGVPVLNYGVSGDTTRDGLARLDTAVAENPKVALVLLGGNDFLQKIPRAETFANLEKIVTTFQSHGAMVILLGVRSGLLGGGADSEYEALAKKTHSAYVSDVLAGIFAHSALMSDAIHPNDAGYAEITKRIAPVLKKLLHS